MHVTFCYSFRQFERIVNILPRVVKFLLMNLLSVSKSNILKVVLAEFMALRLIYDIYESNIRESILAMLCWIVELIESFFYNLIFLNKFSLYFLFKIFWFIEPELNVYSNTFYYLFLLLFSVWIVSHESFLIKSFSNLYFEEILSYFSVLIKSTNDLN